MATWPATRWLKLFANLLRDVCREIRLRGGGWAGDEFVIVATNMTPGSVVCASRLAERPGKRGLPARCAAQTTCR